MLANAYCLILDKYFAGGALGARGTEGDDYERCKDPEKVEAKVSTPSSEDDPSEDATLWASPLPSACKHPEAATPIESSPGLFARFGS